MRMRSDCFAMDLERIWLEQTRGESEISSGLMAQTQKRRIDEIIKPSAAAISEYRGYITPLRKAYITFETRIYIVQ